MSGKRARFDVVGIEVTVHCPHCDSPAKSPLNGDGFVWNAAAIQHTAGRDIKCKCRRWFRLPYALRQLLKPSTEPVSHDLHVSGVAQVEIFCANCSGDATEPNLTLLTTDGRCSKCGGRSYEVANKPGYEIKLNINGKEL
jgi:Zn finger protein HypA/HybF involved in hydrogenase expression